MQHVFYRIAGITIRVSLDFTFFTEFSYLNSFQISNQDTYDYDIVFQQVNQLSEWHKCAGQLVSSYGPYHFFMNDKGEEFCFFLYREYFHAVSYFQNNQIKCYYVSQEWLKTIASNGFMLENFFLLEKIFMDRHSMVLHSCHIQNRGKSILFSAPSGTGKSTQGQLWNTYKNAEIINGDRTIIRHNGEQWMAYGSPFCGTSGIRKNKMAPLQVIVVLRQASYNKARILKGREAFFAIYSEVTIHTWDRTYVNAAINWVSELIQSIPIVLFECTKDSFAVEYLDDFLSKHLFSPL